LNTKLSFANSIRILGLAFDSKLNWQLHLKKLKTDYQSRLKTIKTLGNNSWGSDTKSLITIYKALIQFSSIDYRDIYNSTKKKDLNTLNPTHNEGIRFAIRAFMTSPVNSILFHAREPPPLKYRRQSHTLKYVTKIKNLTDHIIKNIIYNSTHQSIVLPKRNIRKL
jgi:hypothetical protein